ncbi:MAG: hypothetical protein MHPSP_000278 [Paramarteilia canceri]
MSKDEIDELFNLNELIAQNEQPENIPEKNGALETIIDTSQDSSQKDSEKNGNTSLQKIPLMSKVGQFKPIICLFT